jgi:hypothetical protein
MRGTHETFGQGGTVQLDGVCWPPQKKLVRAQVQRDVITSTYGSHGAHHDEAV